MNFNFSQKIDLKYFLTTFWLLNVLITCRVLSLEDLDHDHLLCLTCGTEISDISEDNFFNITSPLSEAKRLVKPTNLFLQVLRNPSGSTFQVLTLQSAGCVGVGEWFSEHTWFHNYSWQICICPHCQAHIGCFKLFVGGYSKVPKVVKYLKMASDIVKVETNPAEAVPEDLDFLKELEELAKSRYTEGEEFDAVTKGSLKPPIQPTYGNERDHGNYRDKRRNDRYNGSQRQDWDRDRSRNFGYHNNRGHYGRY